MDNEISNIDEIEKEEKVNYIVNYADLPEQTEIIGIKFRKKGKTYYFAPNGFVCNENDRVIVDTSRGMEYGYVVVPNRVVKTVDLVLPLRSVLRMATEEETKCHEENLLKEIEAYNTCIALIDKHTLEMKLVDVELSFDRSKLLFYFSSDARVDFRDLVKDLAATFRTRIEMRQIGIRDEAKLLGGLGICGRPFCCSSFLSDFVQVSVKMAKEQNLSLNSAKISGACGRLMCCLRYEYDTYLAEKALTPEVDTRVITPDGPGVVISANPLAGIVKVKLDKNQDNNEVVYVREDVTKEDASSENNNQAKEAEINKEEVKEVVLDKETVIESTPIEVAKEESSYEITENIKENFASEDIKEEEKEDLSSNNSTEANVSEIIEKDIVKEESSDDEKIDEIIEEIEEILDYNSRGERYKNRNKRDKFKKKHHNKRFDRENDVNDLNNKESSETEENINPALVNNENASDNIEEVVVKQDENISDISAENENSGNRNEYKKNFKKNRFKNHNKNYKNRHFEEKQDNNENVVEEKEIVSVEEKVEDQSETPNENNSQHNKHYNNRYHKNNHYKNHKPVENRENKPENEGSPNVPNENINNEQNVSDSNGERPNKYRNNHYRNYKQRGHKNNNVQGEEQQKNVPNDNNENVSNDVSGENNHKERHKNYRPYYKNRHRYNKGQSNKENTES